MDRAAHDAGRGRTERSSPIVIQGNQDVPVVDSTLRSAGHDHSQSRENMHAVPQVGRQAYHRTVIDKSTEVFGGDLIPSQDGKGLWIEPGHRKMLDQRAQPFRVDGHRRWGHLNMNLTVTGIRHVPSDQG